VPTSRHTAAVTRRRLLIVVAVAVLAACGPLVWLRGCSASATTALAGGFASLGADAEDAPLIALHEQVARLGSENAVLRARLDDYAQIAGEGGQVIERTVMARGRVISRTRRTGRRYLELDVGRVDGVEKGMPVVMGWSLVGQVAGTDDGRCLVQEITDRESRVAAALLDPGPTEKPKILSEGVLSGDGRSTTAVLGFVDLPPEAPVRAGLTVVTAGADGRFPAGLVLGVVMSASHAGTDAWQIAVTPLRNPDTAESLLVLRNGR
jgi:hypothetical protein